MATNYIVLSQDASGYWTKTKTVDAVSADAAVKAALDGKATLASAGTYVAVPERSWKPVQVKVETETKVRISDATSE